jgi:hypothetical protein
VTIRGDRTGGVRAIASRWARSVSDLPRWIWVAAAAVAALLIVVIATGGLAQALTEPRSVDAGDEVRTGQLSVTVLDAEFTREVESEYLDAEDGEVLLVMTLAMENLTDHPIGVGTTADRIDTNLVNHDEPLLGLVGVEPTDNADVWRADGSAGQVYLQPGVPDEVMIAWPVPEDAMTGDAVALDVHEAAISTGAVLLSSRVVTWRAADIAARIVIPVSGTS